MSPVLQIIMAIGSVVVLLGLMAVVRGSASRFGLSAELQRKLVHIGTGLYALTLPWLFPERWPVYVLVGVTIVVMFVLRMPRFSQGGIGATLHGVDRQSYGDMMLAVAVGLCLFFAEDQLYLYVLPIAVLTLADAAAALAGTAYGRRFFNVEDGQKSLEGCVVFFGVTLVLAMVCLMTMTAFAPFNIILLALMVAGFGTLVEAVSWRGFDNLFLPMGLLVFLASHADRNIWDLVALAGLFAATLVGFRAVAPIVGLTNHASRVYVTTVFLLLAVTAFHNAVLPISIFLAHAWSRSAASSNSNFPDLDVVAGVVLLSIFWLTVGNASGWNAVSFYGMSAMAMTMGFCALAMMATPLFTRALGIGAIVITLLGIRSWSVAMNGELRNWNGPMWGEIGLSFTLILVLTLWLPNRFMHFRVTKITCLACLVPLITFVVKTNFGGML